MEILVDQSRALAPSATLQPVKLSTHAGEMEVMLLLYKVAVIIWIRCV